MFEVEQRLTCSAAHSLSALHYAIASFQIALVAEIMGVRTRGPWVPAGAAWWYSRDQVISTVTYVTERRSTERGMFGSTGACCYLVRRGWKAYWHVHTCASYVSILQRQVWGDRWEIFLMIRDQSLFDEGI